jgi:hypothetical protein
VTPDYVEQRLRRPPSSDSMVVAGSTPVIAFGNPGGARVATLGLNPSRQEFLDVSGNELDVPDAGFRNAGVSACAEPCVGF